MDPLRDTLGVTTLSASDVSIGDYTAITTTRVTNAQLVLTCFHQAESAFFCCSAQAAKVITVRRCSGLFQLTTVEE